MAELQVLSTLDTKRHEIEAYIGSLERSQENVSIDSLVRIAKSMKVTVGDLVSGL